MHFEELSAGISNIRSRDSSKSILISVNYESVNLYLQMSKIFSNGSKEPYTCPFAKYIRGGGIV